MPIDDPRTFPAAGAGPQAAGTGARFTGPLFDRVDGVVTSSPDYRAFRNGTLSRAGYASFLDRMAPALAAAGVPADDVHFAKRYPASIERFVDEAVDRLAREGMLGGTGYDRAACDAAAEAAGRFDHGGFGTYIYPEEGRLLFAVADLLRPRNALFLGSYYGYWAAWAVPAIVGRGGCVTLVDPDQRSCEVARRNLTAPPHGHGVRVVPATGQDFLADTDETFDLVVLDAELPHTHPVPEERGKGIYHALLRACLPRLAPCATLVCHNILFTDPTADPFFDEVIARNGRELAAFRRLVAQAFDGFVEITSTEGVGIGARGR